MKNFGSKFISTERLELRAQTMKEQKYLWELLMNPDVNKYFLNVPIKFRDKLKSWEKQKEYYQKDLLHANDLDVYRWSVFLKDTDKCIGRISCHERNTEDENITDPSIRGVGWIIDPKYQGLGYGTEAAKAMIDYMFNECEIEQIITGAAVCNPASWKIMEKLGFSRLNETKMVQYTFLDSPTEIYQYNLTKKEYFNS